MKRKSNSVQACRVVVLKDGSHRRVPAYQSVPLEKVQRGDMVEWKRDLERRKQRASQGLLQRLFSGIGR